MLTTTFAVALVAALLPTPTSAAGSDYKLVQEYSGSNFFDGWSWWNTTDPTEGFVNYYTLEGAKEASLAGFALDESSGETTAYIGVDYTNEYAVGSLGRPSVRITSEASFSNGALFIADIRHSPLGLVCGTWPAFWLVGPDWPNQGEIDIIEGVNDQQFNQMTLHTGDDCTVNNASMIGTLMETSCTSSNTDGDIGCGVTAQNAVSYNSQDQKSVELNTGGLGFNAQDGGTYAALWSEEGIQIFMFPAGSVPQDILDGQPDPTSWTTKPLASFTGSGCDYFTKFSNLQIVFDNTMCGEWAGQVWSGSTCAAKTGVSTCEAYVGQNPAAFKDSFWNVASVKVYQTSTGTSTGTTASKKRSVPELDVIDLSTRTTAAKSSSTTTSKDMDSIYTAVHEVHAHRHARLGNPHLHARTMNKTWLSTASSSVPTPSSNSSGAYHTPTPSSFTGATSDASTLEVFCWMTAAVLFLVLAAVLF